jgi:hypothetical protein
MRFMTLVKGFEGAGPPPQVVGGYAVFKVPSKQEMIEATVRFMELHRQYWPGWDGETEIREMTPMPAHSPEAGR